MPDLLAHALIGYTVGMVLAWRYDWLSPAHLTAVMAGTLIPDITKIQLVIPSGAVEHFFGIPFSWGAIHTGGGAIVAVLIGAVLVASHERIRIGVLLSVGAVTHLIADGLLMKPSGRSFAMLWPLTRWHPPTPGLYLSTQVEPTLLAAGGAVTVWLISQINGSGSEQD